MRRERSLLVVNNDNIISKIIKSLKNFFGIKQEEIKEEEMNKFYNLTDLEHAMEFALISEGILKSDKVFDTANVMSVRLHTLATGDNRYYFEYPKYVTKLTKGTKADLIFINEYPSLS